MSQTLKDTATANNRLYRTALIFAVIGALSWAIFMIGTLTQPGSGAFGDVETYLENANSGEKTLRYLLPILQRVELTDEAYYEIVDYCKRKEITFMCSAFDAESADFVDQLGVPAFKVASADMTNIPFQDDSVDVVVCLEGFEHVSEAVGIKFLDEVVRITADDGLLVMTIPVILPGRKHSGNPHHLHERSRLPSWRT